MQSANRTLVNILLGLIIAVIVGVSINTARAATLDFSTDDFGTTLTDGQSISTAARADFKGVPFSTDTVLEFGNIVSISTSISGGDGHLGAAIFDSSIGGPNDGGVDDDLVVGLGNILILQNDEDPATTLDATYGLLFDTPNDEKSADDAGSIIFDFAAPVSLSSIDLIDINGGNYVELTLTDGSAGGGLTRSYMVAMDWTGGTAYDTLDLTTLADQIGGGGGLATASEDAGFNPADVRQLEVAFAGNPTSGGLDNIVFTVVPVPPAFLLFGSAVAWLIGWRRYRVR